MAVQHVYFNDQTEYGRKLRRGLNLLEEGFEALVDIRDAMTFMLDGDGTQVAHFAYHVSKFGFPTTAEAKAAYDEVNSLLGKLQSDGPVTFMNAALLQAFKKLR